MIDTGQIQSVPPPASNENQQEIKKNGIKTVWIIIIFFILVLGGFSYFVYKSNIKSPLMRTTNFSTPVLKPVATPTPEIIDAAPATPANQKAKILVHHSDSTFSVYLVPLAEVSAFGKTLPQGDIIVNISNPH